MNYTNFGDTGFNVNSPLVQNMFANSTYPGYTGMAYSTPKPPIDLNMGYPMDIPVTTKSFSTDDNNESVEKTIPIQYQYNSMPSQSQQLVSPFNIGYSYQQPQNPIGFNYYNMPNNSFYNNLYNNYYNPYMAQYQQQQQKQLQEIEARQRAEAESRVWKHISRGLNAISNNPLKGEELEEHLKQYDPVDFNEYKRNIIKGNKSTLRVRLVSGEDIICDPAKNGFYSTEDYRVSDQYSEYIKKQEQAKSEQLVYVELYGIPYNMEIARRIEYNNQMYDARKKEFPDSMGLIEYLNNAGALYSEALMYRYKMKKLDLSNRYDQSNFRERILSGAKSFEEMYVAQCFGPPDISGVRPGPSLGSLEVSLPPHLASRSNEYERRREEFLNNILRR